MEVKNSHLKDVKKKYIILILKYIIILKVYTQIEEILSSLKYAEKLVKTEQIKLKSNEKLKME